jgi:hypothetical protein
MLFLGSLPFLHIVRQYLYLGPLLRLRLNELIEEISSLASVYQKLAATFISLGRTE